MVYSTPASRSSKGLHPVASGRQTHVVTLRLCPAAVLESCAETCPCLPDLSPAWEQVGSGVSVQLVPGLMVKLLVF